MANKNIQIKDIEGNLLFPKTNAKVVINNNGDNLGDVEAAAQVNKLEEIKVNGSALTIADKSVNIEIPAAAEYSVTKQATAEDGYSATYQLTKDGVAVGEKINIPKDMVVSAGEVKKCTTAGSPVAGLAKGDPYIELTIANNDGTKLYIPVKDLVDVYTAGDSTIKIENNAITVDLDELKKTFATSETVNVELAKKADKATTLAGYGIADAKIEDGVITLGENTITPLTQHQDISGKADKATTLVGYGITDAYTKTETDTAITNAIAGYLLYEELTDGGTRDDVQGGTN